MRMDHIAKAIEIIGQISDIAKKENKKTGFSIGNTSKPEVEGLYFTPIRNTALMVVGGVVAHSVKQAIEVVQAVDGKVDYILVDTEKKVAPSMSLTGEPANIERAVRENTHTSKLWVYKGNDLAVEAVDSLLSHLFKDSTQGLGGKRVAILGAGNLGAKLAIKLVERAASVVITRRDAEKLDIITRSINIMKPVFTEAEVTSTTDNEQAAKGAQILIGATQGTPVITAAMIYSLAAEAIIIDVGKGVLFPEAIDAANTNGNEIYRLDVSAAFHGLISTLWSMEEILENKMGRRQIHGESIVSGGLLAAKDEIVVDNVWNPNNIYGIADGKGDFFRGLSAEQSKRLNILQKCLSAKDDQ